MPVWIARTVPRQIDRGGSACHGGDSANVACHARAPGCAAPRHVSLGKLQSDAWAGELERTPEVVVRRGKWLAAVVVLPHLRACRSSGLAEARGAPRRASLGVSWLGRPGELLPPGPWCFGLVVPASSSCRGLAALARQAPLAGPRLLGPASSSCRGLVFLARSLGLRPAQKGPWRLLLLPWQALPRDATTARAQVWGTKVPLL